MFHSILVATDGSPHAEAAVLQARDIAKAQGARVTVLAAFGPLSALTGDVSMTLATVDTVAILDAMKKGAENSAERAQQLIGPEVATTVRVVEARPSDAIQSAIREGEYDLVAVGSRGLSGMKSLFLGSVSNSVVHNSTVPVLVVHIPEA
jgi:nucleotide-binding universal stress UspA family protein